MMIRCRVCNKRKPQDQFYPRQIRKSGKVGECKSCTRQRVRENRNKRASYYREYDKKRFQDDPRVRARHKRYQATEAGKKSMKRSRVKWLEANPEKRAAHVAVGHAVRSGKLEKPEQCECCGKSGTRIHGHHEDYSKPLDVVWLCPDCHAKEHKDAA